MSASDHHSPSMEASNRYLDKMITLVHDFERFTVGFGKSAGVILASEIGDKTFFIAAVRVASRI